MKRGVLYILAAYFCSCAAFAATEDMDDFVSLLVDVREAYVNCDADALQTLAHPNWFGAFNADGPFVRDTKHTALRTQCAQGARVDFQCRILKTEVTGNWAVVVFLATSEITAPNGEKTTRPLRATWVLAKHDGRWKRYHVHVSELQDPPVLN